MNLFPKGLLSWGSSSLFGYCRVSLLWFEYGSIAFLTQSIWFQVWTVSILALHVTTCRNGASCLFLAESWQGDHYPGGPCNDSSSPHILLMRLLLIAITFLLLLNASSGLQCKDGEDYLRMVKKSRMNGYNDMFTIKDNSPFSELFVSPDFFDNETRVMETCIKANENH